MDKLLLLIFASFLVVSTGWSRPVDLSAPKNTFPSVSSVGTIFVKTSVDQVDFGGGVKLPVRINFSSADRYSPALGENWIFPLLESKTIFTSETAIRLNLLCGKVLFLYQKADSPETFVTRDKQWIGRVKKNIIIVSRDDGWEMEFDKGLLKKLRTDTGRIFSWFYEHGRVTSIQERGKNAQFRITYDGKDGLAKEFIVNDRKYSCTVDGGRMEKLSVLKPKSNIMDEVILSTVARVEKSLRLTLVRKGMTNIYQWGVESRKAEQVNDFAFEIEKVDGSVRPKITRVHPNGDTEFRYYHTGKGIYYSETLDGTQWIKHYYLTRGPLYMKVRRVEKHDVDSGVTEITESYSYDKLGRMVRLTTPGSSYAMKYNKLGELTEYKDLNDKTAKWKKVSSVIANLLKEKE